MLVAKAVGKFKRLHARQTGDVAEDVKTEKGSAKGGAQTEAQAGANAKATEQQGGEGKEHSRQPTAISIKVLCMSSSPPPFLSHLHPVSHSLTSLALFPYLPEEAFKFHGLLRVEIEKLYSEKSIFQP